MTDPTDYLHDDGTPGSPHLVLGPNGGLTIITPHFVIRLASDVTARLRDLLNERASHEADRQR